MNNQNLMVPIAIVLAGGFIAGALYFGAGKSPADPSQNGSTSPKGNVSAMRPIDATDHIAGNPQADVIIVEYSDIDCPYCKQFHPTIERLMTEYGASGKLAWVYRHFPLTQLHPDAARHAEAAECAASLGGSETFFTFLNGMFSIAGINGKFDPARYGEVAKSIGISEDRLATCLADGTYKKRVQTDYDNAVASGGTGTPFNIILVKGQEPIVAPGSLPYEQLKQAIDIALKTTSQ